MSAEKAPGGTDAGRLSIEIKDDREHNLVQVALKGRIDVFTYQDLGQRMAGVYNERADVAIVMDFSQVAFVASSGWATLLTLRSRLARLNGRLALAGMSQDLYRIYESMRLEALVPCYPDAGQAVRALAAR